MSVVVDTSVLIDHLRGRAEARDALRSLVGTGEVLSGSVLTRAEVVAGMRPVEEPTTLALLDVIEWIPVSAEVADAAGRLAQQFLRSHPGVDTADCVIAATAMSVGARLWTRDVTRFPMFPELTAPY